ncbi:MAG: RidA family protein [Candidatus Eremiobacteraeota bacterium]|nr:RidA family protein [Candidatus Eremiobacteraeota bacterium]
MEKIAIQTAAAPAALGPYSQAIRCGDTVYVSGQLPIDPASGKLVEGGIREQTRRLFANLRAILEAAGSTLNRVVKVTVFIADWGDFAAFNEVYAEQFEAPFPARSTIQNSRPLGALVGADVVAVTTSA